LKTKRDATQTRLPGTDPSVPSDKSVEKAEQASVSADRATSEPTSKGWQSRDQSSSTLTQTPSAKKSEFEAGVRTTAPSGPHVPLPQFGLSGDPHQREVFPGDLTNGFVPGENSPLGPYLRSATARVDDVDYLRTYVTHLTKSLREGFIPALQNGLLHLPTTDEDTRRAFNGGWSRQASEFLGALKKQHDILILGQSREQLEASGQVISTDQAYRGLWQGKHQTIPHLDALFESAIDPNSKYPNPEGAYRFGMGSRSSTYGEPVTEGPLRIEHMPEAALPRIEPTALSLTHLSQPFKYMPLMLHRMAELQKSVFEAIDSLPEIQVSQRPPEMTHIVDMLSDYLHIAANTHLFERGNVSLFMSHVNYALERAGLTPIEHQGLDVTAMGKHFDEFRPVFRKAVIRANPEASIRQNPQVSLTSGSTPSAPAETKLHSGPLVFATATPPDGSNAPGITSISFVDELGFFKRAQFVKLNLQFHDPDGKQQHREIWLERAAGHERPEYGPRGPKPVPYDAVSEEDHALLKVPAGTVAKVWIEGAGNVDSAFGKNYQLNLP
jgi:hypothetical protein